MGIIENSELMRDFCKIWFRDMEFEVIVFFFFWDIFCNYGILKKLKIIWNCNIVCIFKILFSFIFKVINLRLEF